MNIVERLNEAIERLEPVEKLATVGPWHSDRTEIYIVSAEQNGHLPAGEEIGVAEFWGTSRTPSEQSAAFIAAMRPTSEPEYYTRLLRDAAREIRLLTEQLQHERSKREQSE